MRYAEDASVQELASELERVDKLLTLPLPVVELRKMRTYRRKLVKVLDSKMPPVDRSVTDAELMAELAELGE